MSLDAYEFRCGAPTGTNRFCGQKVGTASRTEWGYLDFEGDRATTPWDDDKLVRFHWRRVIEHMFDRRCIEVKDTNPLRMRARRWRLLTSHFPISKADSTRCPTYSSVSSRNTLVPTRTRAPEATNTRARRPDVPFSNPVNGNVSSLTSTVVLTIVVVAPTIVVAAPTIVVVVLTMEVGETSSLIVVVVVGGVGSPKTHKRTWEILCFTVLSTWWVPLEKGPGSSMFRPDLIEVSTN